MAESTEGEDSPPPLEGPQPSHLKFPPLVLRLNDFSMVKENMNNCLCPCFYQKRENKRQRRSSEQHKIGKILFLHVKTIDPRLIRKNLHSFLHLHQALGPNGTFQFRHSSSS